MDKTVRVWDPLVRVLHWSLVLAVAASWLSTLAFYKLHQPAGYLALGIVLLRVLWGRVGSHYARFGQFVCGPRAIGAYALALLQRREPRHIGHNPLGACMILLLLGCVASLGLTGWMYTSDAFWGDATVEFLHTTLAWSLLVLIALHVAGVLFTGARQRESLVRAMVTGRKRATHGDAFDQNVGATGRKLPLQCGAVPPEDKGTEPMSNQARSAVHELHAYLCVRDAGAAVEFYKQAFGATERFRLVEPSGRIGHVELQLGPAVLMLADEFPEYGVTAPPRDGTPGTVLHLHVDNADSMAARAVTLGATMLSAPTDEFYGERGCRLRDPFGHTWKLGHSIEEVTPEEMQRRYTAMLEGG